MAVFALEQRSRDQDHVLTNSARRTTKTEASIFERIAKVGADIAALRGGTMSLFAPVYLRESG